MLYYNACPKVGALNKAIPYFLFCIRAEKLQLPKFDALLCRCLRLPLFSNYLSSICFLGSLDSEETFGEVFVQIDLFTYHANGEHKVTVKSKEN